MAYYIAEGAVVKGQVTMADGASVWYNATVRGDSEPIEIGRNSNIQDNADFGEVLFRIRIVCVPIHITSLPPVPAFCGLQTLFSSSLLSYLYGFVPCRTGCAPTPSILQSPYGHWVA